MADRIPLILLCAGKSERTGIPKGLIEIKEGSSIKPWLQIQLEKIPPQIVSEVVIVLGFHKERYLEALQKIHCPVPFRTVINEDPSRGQFSSVKTGVSSIRSDHAFLTLIDVPVCKEETFKNLLDENDKADAIIPVCEGRGGHPVILSKKIIDTILRVEASERLDKILSESDKMKVTVKDDSILKNQNHIEQFIGARS